jgi:hypothetical protein
MENPTKAITATLKTIIAIAATSMMESRLIMRQCFRRSSDGVDLDQLFCTPREVTAYRLP